MNVPDYHSNYTERARAAALAESASCPLCFMRVTPENWLAHYTIHHPDQTAIPFPTSDTLKAIDLETGEITDALTTDERTELNQCETVIERGIKVFFEVGEALLSIRDKRLYRATHHTFEQYCRERWDMSRRRANQLIESAAVIGNLGTIVPKPANEAQARELVTLTPDEQRLVVEVVKQTAPNGKPTAAHYRSVANVLKEVTTTGAIDNGTGEQIKVADVFKAAVIEETYERMKRQEQHIADAIERKEVLTPDFDYKRDAKSSRAANEYEPQGYDACQTPAYAFDPLLPYLQPEWTLWEPARGEGMLVEAMLDSGFKSVVSSDILTQQNFFDYAPDAWDALITNPPFSLKFRWIERCYALGKPFALLLPVETLGAKTAQELFRQHGIEVIFLDKRVNFKMPNKGWDGGGAQFPVAWFTWGLNIGQQMTFARMNDVTH